MKLAVDVNDDAKGGGMDILDDELDQSHLELEEEATTTTPIKRSLFPCSVVLQPSFK
jgi:hypothetical protein